MIRNACLILVHSAIILKIWLSAKFLIQLKIVSLKMVLTALMYYKGIALPQMDIFVSNYKKRTFKANIAGRMMDKDAQATEFPSVNPLMDQCAMCQIPFLSRILIASQETI
jgi:hypothetical protein